MPVLIAAILAFGVALVHLALAAGSGPALMAIGVALGIAELAWAAGTLHRRRLLVPRAALAVAVAPILAWVAAATVGLPLPPGMPFALGSVLALVIAGILAASLRWPDRAEQRQVRPWRAATAIVLSAAAVSATVTPALAATEAGEYAVPHGTHSGH